MPKSQTRSLPPKTLTGLLEGSDVLTSSELIHKLGRAGFTSENARQVIRRRANTADVWRSEKLRLANNERIFASRAVVGTPSFLQAVSDKLATTKRKGLARCVATISNVHVLHKVDVMRLLAVSPLRVNGGPQKRLYDEEVAGLKELGIRIIHEGTTLESLVSPTIPKEENADAIALLATERLRHAVVLARILAERFRRQNMLSWNHIEMPDPEVPYTIFNGQVYSAYGFSYLSPLTRWKEGSSSPIPCPVLIDCYHDLCRLQRLFI